MNTIFRVLAENIFLGVACANSKRHPRNFAAEKRQ